jgi:hypothetical protein
VADVSGHPMGNPKRRSGQGSEIVRLGAGRVSRDDQAISAG